jgi:hypothetical protein
MDCPLSLTSLRRNGDALMSLEADIELSPDRIIFQRAAVEKGKKAAITGFAKSLTWLKLRFPAIDDYFIVSRQTTPPSVEKIAFITLDENARIDDRFGRQEFYVVKNGSNYSISNPILANGNIGVEILAKDRFIPGGQFYGGVNFIEMRVDGNLVFQQNIDKINTEETRGIYTLMNYKTLKTKGTRFYKLYIDDGNVLPFYNASPSTGRLMINGTKEYKVEIRLKDSFNNTSTMSFRIKPTPVTQEVKTLPKTNVDAFYEIEENVMMVTAKPWLEGGNKATLFVHDSTYQIDPTYYGPARMVYLIDLRKQLPDSVLAAGKILVTEFKSVIPPATDYKYLSDQLDITFPANSLYDTLYLSTSLHQVNGNDIVTVGDRAIPLNRNITIAFKPSKEITDSINTAVYRLVGKSSTYLGGKRTDDGKISFQSREFGTFAILTDNTPPSIYPVSLNSNTVRFKIRDDLSGISSYNAYINGEWLLMHYDAKTASLRSERKDKNVPLNGALELIVTDNAGNEQSYKTNIQ